MARVELRGNVQGAEASVAAVAGWLNTDGVAYHARSRPTQTAVVELKTGERLSFQALDARVAKAVGALRRLIGEPAGARVAILARSGIDQLVLLFACHRAAAIFQPLNWRLSSPELEALVADAGPALFVYETEFEREALKAAAGAPAAQTLRVAPDDNAFRREVEVSEPATAAPNVAANAPSILLYTSGTTGKPKGVIITRLGAFFSCLNFQAISGVGPDSVLLCDAPMFHTVGLMAVAKTAMHCGATLAISDRFVSSATLERISDPDLGVTHYFAVPQIAQALQDDPLRASSDFSRLKCLFVGGSPMPEALTRRFLDDGVLVSNGYGMSEAGTVMHMPLDAGAVRGRPTFVGLPAPAVEVRVVTAEGREAQADEPGEIWLRGPAVTPGYWKQPDATAKAFSDGWFRTGDAAIRDADGFYRLIDRWKDMYITGGENVYPAEVEAVLLAVPGVAEAAVVGYPDAQWGESGCAFIVACDGAALSEAVVIAHCQASMAGYKRPRKIRFVEAIPHNASGKILKDRLREGLAGDA